MHYFGHGLAPRALKSYVIISIGKPSLNNDSQRTIMTSRKYKNYNTVPNGFKKETFEAVTFLINKVYIHLSYNESTTTTFLDVTSTYENIHYNFNECFSVPCLKVALRYNILLNTKNYPNEYNQPGKGIPLFFLFLLNFYLSTMWKKDLIQTLIAYANVRVIIYLNKDISELYKLLTQSNK